MLSSKTYEIISILYNVYSAGYCCEEVAVRIQLLMFQGPGDAKLNAWHLPPYLARYQQNNSRGRP